MIAFSRSVEVGCTSYAKHKEGPVPASEGVPQEDLQILEEHDWVDSIVSHATQPRPEAFLCAHTNK